MRATLRSSISTAIALTAALTGIAVTVTAFVLRDSAYVWVAVAIAAAASVVIAGFAGALVARRQTQSLERLGVAARSLASGAGGTRAETDGPRETRIVAEAVNQLAGQVDRALDELHAEERRKTQFVSDVSHELRTPLTAIRGAAETLLDGDVEPDDQQRFLSTIALEAERLTRLANDLLTLQRIEGATGELPLRVVDLRLAAERSRDMLEPLLEDRGVTLEIRGDSVKVLGDIDRLQQIVTNLVDNASRIVGTGGHVWVDLSTVDDKVVFQVADDGPGIPEADLPRLFDRFYRADSSRARSMGGAGLGLAIVKAIASAHGGQIEAANRDQGGSVFTVTLPAIMGSENARR